LGPWIESERDVSQEALTLLARWECQNGRGAGEGEDDLRSD
jgi:hypothetical protein